LKKNRLAFYIALVLIAALSLATVACASQPTREASPQPQTPVGNASPAPEAKPAGENRVAYFETNRGNFAIELFEDKAPVTTKNFIDLVNRNFYNGLIFHRVIANFMIQGGCPSGNGTGGPGYRIPDEFHPDLKHNAAGILSMANAGPNTGGSQFFITLRDTPWLDGKHAVFGKVVEGMDVIYAIGNVRTGRNDRPLENVVINKITIK